MGLFRIISAPLAALVLAAAPVPSLRPTATAASAADNASARLQAEYARLAQATDGGVGVAVRSLDKGRVLGLNADQPFPMASAFKVAVAGTILSMADAGALRLDDMLSADPARYVESDGIADLAPHPGVMLSVHNLLDLMLTRSDNNATDILIARAGGPAVVDAWLRKAHVGAMRVDSNTADLLYRAMGIRPGPGTYRENVAAAKLLDPMIKLRDRQDVPNDAFADDPRDSASPRAMLDLLSFIRAGKLLSKESTALLLDIMAHCRTGEGRLKAHLPPGTPIAHKTGSLNGTGNDVGIVTLPDGRAFAVVVFIKKDRMGREVRDRLIADIARATYDYYLLIDG